MKTFVVAMMIVLLSGTMALAHPLATVPVPVPAPAMVYGYYPPAYAYPPAVVAIPGRYMVASPVLVPAPVVAPVPAMVPAPVYARPVVVHPKFYYPGQPVRNVLRAVTP